MKPRLIVFAKCPLPGNVKTRLARRIGHTGAAEVYKAMALDLLDLLMRLGDEADIEIHLDTHSDFFQQYPLPIRLQVGDSLGEKIHYALHSGLTEGAKTVAILGSDTPELSLDALRPLLYSSAELVFGPATDGGFWGVNASRTAPGMFDGVRWSQPETLQDCLTAAEACGLSTAITTPLNDLDTWDDLIQIDATRIGTRLRQMLFTLLEHESS